MFYCERESLADQDRQTYRQAGRRRQTDRQTGTDRHTERQRQRDRQTDRLTDRQRDRQRETDRERQIEREREMFRMSAISFTNRTAHACSPMPKVFNRKLTFQAFFCSLHERNWMDPCEVTAV